MGVQILILEFQFLGLGFDLVKLHWGVSSFQIYQHCFKCQQISLCVWNIMLKYLNSIHRYQRIFLFLGAHNPWCLVWVICLAPTWCIDGFKRDQPQISQFLSLIPHFTKILHGLLLILWFGTMHRISQSHPRTSYQPSFYQSISEGDLKSFIQKSRLDSTCQSFFETSMDK